ncbi:MAG TPA: 50S ribosomal protein L23 [Candidatus Ratteibacteria bacterium]|jgi:large subunit ribosomal protein L23|uniref:Large ribosomal subunit protein uL23 n=1 Tax=candidate division TA06 bacterium ADurb.Bin131 TaxID=1852827 RepID=A0A1V6C4M4_UNCT6|nr:MAG: 50S ribosomal protein L23 [candidate division TA06 bacterium ADurb.Bin131]HOC03016.1 50S ribosomal protein L23 [bacterium]HRS06273.1 50S ribosomal protein L23 [Candidatus Ratteibacteria bacterium]HON04877.1 50S ribosomal protein L23 [bacterium]HPC29465.1 50S ribosomal protein L23 [bacterium]
MFNPYTIIKYPRITEKATALSAENKYLFVVPKNVKKYQIKMAIEQIYKVSVVSVAIVNMPGKKRRYRMSQEGYKPSYKKAIVTLKEGDKIAIT